MSKCFGQFVEIYQISVSQNKRTKPLFHKIRCKDTTIFWNMQIFTKKIMIFNSMGQQLSTINQQFLIVKNYQK